jgi:adenylate kinase family enzyme
MTIQPRLRPSPHVLVLYYTKRGVLVGVDADQPPDSVTADIQARLSALP